MNRIAVKAVLTPYAYEEQYITVDGTPIVNILDRLIQAAQDETCLRFGTVLGLYPAWGSELLHEGERRFIQTLIAREEPTNLPILVCEDDLDLSCMVFVAAVRKEASRVYWDRIGYIDHQNEDFQIEKRSGISCLEAYSEEDWRRCGDNIAAEQVDSPQWREWISANWSEELYRRRMNYTLPYYMEEKNVVWLGEPGFCFDRSEYENCVSAYTDSRH